MSKSEQLIFTAKNLFWTHGIRKISVEEICREAKVSKMTFYKHFKNKNDLVKIIINRLQEQGFADYREIMESNLPFSEKIKKQIQLKFENTKDLGEAFLMDIHQLGDQEIIDYFNEKRNLGLQVILTDYVQAQKQGDIRRDIKPEFILFFLNHMYELAKNPQLLALYGSPQALIVELVQFFFYGIMTDSKDQ